MTSVEASVQVFVILCAVCPPQFYPIFRAIYEWENSVS